MTNSIKITYNWIGPRGPIVNTELPNILGFAAVAEGAHVSGSQSFWPDDIFWRMFLNNEPYSLSSTFDITDKDTFVHPFPLTWRVPFETYFYPGAGILEHSHTPVHIVDKIRNYTHHGFILLECAAEAWVRPEQLSRIHIYFSSTGIPLGKIIYLTGCMNGHAVYNKWCDENNIPNDINSRMNIISYPTARYQLAGMINDSPEPEYNSEIVPEKLFLCWNRRFRPHRTLLILSLDKLGLVDRSYYSMGKVDPEFQSQEFTQTTPVDLVNGNIYNINTEDMNNLNAKLPLVIDGETSIGNMCADNLGHARKFYQNSLVSLVTETNWELPHLTSTEKSFKPFKEKHPFIIVGSAGAIKSMRELGFKTFSDFWDESYDETDNYNLRLVKIIEVCKEISTWDNEKILDFRRKVKPIVEHNYLMLKNSTARDIADQIKVIIEKRKMR
jgi:hypothetical protein